MKSPLSAMALALTVAFSGAAARAANDTAGPDLHAALAQLHSAVEGAILQQEGDANWLALVQESVHLAPLGIDQTGADATADVSQTGSANQACIYQH
ncbi:hypothetical protein RBA41_05405 [Massilia sp. CCM 9210]|uniref:hypothetical protein n=1 Tax=Massilia scottii TaxID=3057166 RepID=UPI002796572F|nr:hypothetical protein [Massilia sp. CCM 9210]MDQ1812736.1 hypothetical protein [Massilia sp. CCM 9210]